MGICCSVEIGGGGFENDEVENRWFVKLKWWLVMDCSMTGGATSLLLMVPVKVGGHGDVLGF